MHVHKAKIHIFQKHIHYIKIDVRLVALWREWREIQGEIFTYREGIMPTPDLQVRVFECGHQKPRGFLCAASIWHQWFTVCL